MMNSTIAFIISRRTSRDVPYLDFRDTATDSAVQLRVNCGIHHGLSRAVSWYRPLAWPQILDRQSAPLRTSTTLPAFAFHFATPHQLLKFGISLSGLGVGAS